jgi:hypothetical protein
MSLFPAYIEDDEVLEEYEEDAEIPKEFGIDFATGQTTGRIVEKVEAIKVWCYFALQIARYRFFICGDDYGNELEDLYGKQYSAEHIKSEGARMIEECLVENDYIRSVTVSNAEYSGGRFRADITIDTVFGSDTIYEYEMEAA